MSEYSFLRKIIILAFTFIVFVTIYAISGQSFSIIIFGKIITVNINTKREILTYMGIMLMITLVYLEILMLRDHLWVLEGGSQEIRRWRDYFFSKESLRRLRIRKMVVVIFSTLIFTYVYLHTRGTEVFSFLGIILMVTVLYFEVLTMRDDLRTLTEAFKVKEIENTLRTEIQKEEKKVAKSGSPEPDDVQPKED